ncbi:MAG TPA: thioesterase family protein [Ktedonobacteraceae bacterium]
MAKTSLLQYRVRWGDTDAAGIVFYPNYFRWFDDAGHEFLRAVGLPQETVLEDRQILLPIIEAGCRFWAPVFYNDLLTIHTSVTELRTRTFRLEHRVLRGEEPTGTGFEVRAWARRPTESKGKLELAPIPDDIRVLLS